MRRIAQFALLFALAVPAALTAQATQVERPLAKGELTAATKEQRKYRFLEQQRARAVQRQSQREVKQKRLAQRQVEREAAGFRRLQVDGSQVRPETEKLARELAWHDSLESAQRVAKRTGKPIVWIHALGNLTGVL